MTAKRQKLRNDDQPVGLTVREVAHRYRVGAQKVLSWVRRGELKAINTSACLAGRPRFVILPDALIAFEKARAAVPELKPARRASRIRDFVDYFPDGNYDFRGMKADQERNGRKLCKKHARNAGWRV